MKVCSKCKKLKSLELFSKRKASKDGLQHKCKPCAKAYKVENKDRIADVFSTYYASNREQIIANQIEYYEANIDKVLAYKKDHYRDNREKIIAKVQEWAAANPDKCNATGAKRRAAKLQRTPSWACFDSIKEFYTCAKDLEELTGIKFHVDHIVPLQGELVSGLHVENNLQILTAYENCSKSNAFEVC